MRATPVSHARPKPDLATTTSRPAHLCFSKAIRGGGAIGI
jgi:hypothetical protein